jgi:hypothetical protein
MDKPLKPKKPLKHENKPTETETIEKIVMLDNKNNVCLLSLKDYEKEVDDEPQWMIDGLDNFGEGLKYSDVLKFKNLLPPEIEDFTIEESTNCDGYYEYTYLTYKEKKNPEQYQKESCAFDNRFKKYESDLKRYEEKLKIYEEFKRKEKLEKLQKELAKIQ